MVVVVIIIVILVSCWVWKWLPEIRWAWSLAHEHLRDWSRFDRLSGRCSGTLWLPHLLSYIRVVIESCFESLQRIEVVHRFYEELIGEKLLHVFLELRGILEFEYSLRSFFGYGDKWVIETYERGTQCEITRREVG